MPIMETNLNNLYIISYFFDFDNTFFNFFKKNYFKTKVLKSVFIIVYNKFIKINKNYM